MKIVSWNCNGRFRDKYQHVLKEKADIYVIQECEDPYKTEDSHYKELFCDGKGFWIPNTDAKGVGVFTRSSDIKLTKLNEWKGENIPTFLPVRVNNEFTLLGVWACDKYCENFYDYYLENQDFIDGKVLMIGDFNSNVKLDKGHPKDKRWSSCVELLAQKNLVDVYNELTGEAEGEETKPTFFMYRKLDKPYHIDRCVAAKGCVKNLEIKADHTWLNLSDHLPIVVER